jgi:membrane protein YdbS with pleckstrin-like domain
MAGTAADEPRSLQFTRLNWILLAAAAVLIVMGYVALASSSPFVSTVMAPVLLVVAYVVLIPLGIIL